MTGYLEKGGFLRVSLAGDHLFIEEFLSFPARPTKFGILLSLFLLLGVDLFKSPDLALLDCSYLLSLFLYDAWQNEFFATFNSPVNGALSLMVSESYILLRELNRNVARRDWPIRNKISDGSGLQLFCLFSVTFWKGSSWLSIMSLKMPLFSVTILVISVQSVKATFHVDAFHTILFMSGRRIPLGGHFKLLLKSFPSISQHLVLADEVGPWFLSRERWAASR